MADEPSDNIIDLREELMVSLSPTGDNKPTLRPAHFLQPSVTSIKEPIFELPSLSPSSPPPIFEPSEWPLKVTYSGWQSPPRDWGNWVDCLQPKYQSLWKKVGIFEAITNSRHVIERNDDMIVGIAERWCSETNTCIFPWGEATLTLEDIMVLGGLSVLGEPVFRPFETQLKEIEEKLIQARVAANRSKARKACPNFWMKMFMNSGSEIEHEAFLVFWLSLFVFPNSRVIRNQVFSIAIHLSKGTQIALAPAVLASIYRDLSLLKNTMVALNKFSPGEDKNSAFLGVVLRSPLQLVQVWAWERFPSLQPKRNLIKCGDPAFARWHRVGSAKIENLRLSLDSAGDSFLWRPYASYTYNWAFPKLYGEKGMWVPVDSNLDEEIEAFARFLRVSKLVGLDNMEQYFPHRVAMQFGMDQDLPGYVARCNKIPETAWNSYSKPVSDVKLYVPSRLSKGGVTTRYLEWWKLSISGMKTVDQALQAAKGNDFPPKCNNFKAGNSINTEKPTVVEDETIPKQVPQASIGKKGFPPKCNYAKAGDSVNVDKPTVLEDKTILKQVLSQASIGKKEGNDADVPPGFPPKCNKVGNSVNEDKSAGEGMIGKRQVGDGTHFLGQSQSFSNDGAVRKMDSMMRHVEKNRDEAEVGGLERAMEGTSESQAGNLVHNMVSINGNEGGCSSDALEIPGLELETRISKLERMIAELKTARFSRRFEEKPPKEGWSVP